VLEDYKLDSSLSWSEPIAVLCCCGWQLSSPL